MNLYMSSPLIPLSPYITIFFTYYKQGLDCYKFRKTNSTLAILSKLSLRCRSASGFQPD